MFSTILGIASALGSLVSGVSGFFGSGMSLDDSKELYKFRKDTDQEYMLTDPTKQTQGLLNAGLSPQLMYGSGSLAGGSGGSASVVPNRSYSDNIGALNQAVSMLDQLKTSQSQRNLLDSEAENQSAQADLARSETEGQKLSNEDYRSAIDLFGGVLSSQSYNNFVNSKITENSIEVIKLSNDFRSAVLRGQIDDPKIIKAVQTTPLNEQERIMSEVAKNYKECNLIASKIITEGSVQELNKALGTNYRSMAEYYDSQKEYINEQTDFNVLNRPFEQNLTIQQIRQLRLANQLATQNNPYSLESAISDLNTAPWKTSFYRGAYNYLLNGIFSVLGSGVQAGATVHAGNRIAETRNQPTSGFGALRKNAPTTRSGRRFSLFK